MFSILILTLNEEKNLPGCLASLAGCDDIVVLDSGSTDQTVPLARAAGARVYTHRFESFARQRNHAHETISFRHPWVFHVDADERFTPELATECSSYTDGETIDGCWVAPKMLLAGKWIRHSTDYPVWQARFVQWRRFRFVDAGHGQREAPGMRLGRLRSTYLHEVLSDGEAAWLDKHRRYAVAEARAHLNGARARWSDLRHSDDVTRRRALKQLSFHLPARGPLRFCYQYLFRGGFLDGSAGWRYCRLLARYERFITQEMRRLRSTTA